MNLFLNFLEKLARRVQLWYMAKRKTTEITEPGRIRFHPKDARVWVLKEYQTRLKKLRVRHLRGGRIKILS